MIDQNKNRISLFITALVQVMFVAMNVVFISKGFVIPMLLTGFMISWLWCSNVKKIAIATIYDKISYATGAMCGTLLGYYFSQYIKTLL